MDIQIRIFFVGLIDRESVTDTIHRYSTYHWQCPMRTEAVGFTSRPDVVATRPPRYDTPLIDVGEHKHWQGTLSSLLSSLRLS